MTGINTALTPPTFACSTRCTRTSTPSMTPPGACPKTNSACWPADNADSWPCWPRSHPKLSASLRARARRSPTSCWPVSRCRPAMNATCWAWAKHQATLTTTTGLTSGEASSQATESCTARRGAFAGQPCPDQPTPGMKCLWSGLVIPVRAGVSPWADDRIAVPSRVVRRWSSSDPPGLVSRSLQIASSQDAHRGGAGDAELVIEHCGRHTGTCRPGQPARMIAR